MDYFRGERVRYLGKADWGPGLIEADSCDGKVCVRFQNAGRKRLDLRFAKIFKVKPPPAGANRSRQPATPFLPPARFPAPSEQSAPL